MFDAPLLRNIFRIAIAILKSAEASRVPFSQEKELRGRAQLAAISDSGFMRSQGSSNHLSCLLPLATSQTLIQREILSPCALTSSFRCFDSPVCQRTAKSLVRPHYSLQTNVMAVGRRAPSPQRGKYRNTSQSALIKL
jgi:hypothetical protein